MFDRPDAGDRALLVHIVLASDSRQADVPDPAASREEFRDLATSAGLEVVDFMTGKRARPHPKLFVGTGKVEEIRLMLENEPVDVVLFGQRLSPSQERNLERELKVRVLDRTSLILDIFAQRARTFEGKLQVELAQLEHLSTRLVRGWTHLERQKGGIGLRGPGETQLETDRRLLGDRVRVLRQRLDKVRRQREQGRAQRSKTGIPTVALVGYTNAGKSTLFNALTHERVYAADQLFATLDPTLRRMELVTVGPVVLADTVGFVRDLPHALVEAFRSTLVETREADLLLHVVDTSDDEREQRAADVDSVLSSIGAADTPQLRVYNKIDRAAQKPEAHIERDADGRPVAAWVSALEQQGLDELLTAISECLAGDRVSGVLRLAAEQGKLRARLYALGAVIDDTVEADGSSLLQLDMDAVDYARLDREYRINDEFEPHVEPLAASSEA